MKLVANKNGGHLLVKISRKTIRAAISEAC